jgi:hypothetical protein
LVIILPNPVAWSPGSGSEGEEQTMPVWIHCRPAVLAAIAVLAMVGGFASLAA